MAIKNKREIIRKCSLVLLGVIAISLLQKCEKFEEGHYYPEFDNSGGMSRLLDELSATQIKEYVEAGKFSSTLKLHAECYKGYSIISNKKAEVTNITVQKGCQDIFVQASMSKIIILENGNLDKEAVEISCSTVDYLVNEDKVAEVKLVDDKPVCPDDIRGNHISPFYRRYPYNTVASQRPPFELIDLKE